MVMSDDISNEITISAFLFGKFNSLGTSSVVLMSINLYNNPACGITGEAGIKEKREYESKFGISVSKLTSTTCRTSESNPF